MELVAVEFYMRDENKTKAQLIAELNVLRERLAHLEQAEAQQHRSEAMLHNRLGIEQLIASLSTKFINLPLGEIDNAINAALQAIGELARVDRSYIFQFSADGALASSTHEWCAPGIAPQAGRLKNMPTRAYSWAMLKLRRLENIHIPSVADLPPESNAERRLLLSLEVASIVMMPISTGMSLLGFLGFDSTQQHQKAWGDADIRLLRLAANIFANVLTRQQGELALRENERKFRSIVEQSADGIVLVNEQGLIIEWNRAQEKISGLRQAEVIGKPVWVAELRMMPKERLTADLSSRMEANFKQLVAAGAGKGLNETIEVIIEHPNGRRIVQQRNFPIKTEHGFMLGSIARDMTPTKQTELLTRQQADDLTLINRLNNAVNQGTSLPDIIETLSTELRRIFACLEVGIYLFSPDRNFLVLQNRLEHPVVVTNAQKLQKLADSDQMEIKLPAHTIYPYAQVVATGQTAVITDPAVLERLTLDFVKAQSSLLPVDDRECLQMYSQLNLGSMLTTPLLANNECIGVIDLLGRHRFTPSEVYRIEALARQLTNIIKRKQTEEKLVEERQLLRTLIDNLPDSIYVKDIHSRFVLNNAAHVALLGAKTQAEVLGKTDLDLFPAEFSQNYYADEQYVFANCRPFTRPEEWVINMTTGVGVWMATTKVPLFDAQGRLTGLVGISRDITSRKNAELELKQLLAAERRQRLLAETLREVTLALAAQTHPTAVLDEILTQVKRLLPYVTANIMLLEGNVLKFGRWSGPPPNVVEQISLPLDSFTLEAAALKNQQPIVIPDTRLEPGWISLNETAWIRSHLALPLCRGKHVLGMLQLNSDAPNAYSFDDVALLEPFGYAAALALDNARLYEQARQDAATKSTLLREVNHRVGNNLTAISGMLALERNHVKAVDRDIYQSLMQDLTNRINGLGIVHNMLSATEWSPLPLDELITRVIHSSLQILPFDKYVVVAVSPSTIKISSDQAHHLALVVNELVTNTIKYALTNREAATVTVTITRQADAVCLCYRDNGPGYPAETLQHWQQNVGLELIDNLMRKSLHGTWNLYNDNGAVTELSFTPDADSKKYAMEF